MRRVFVVLGFAGGLVLFLSIWSFLFGQGSLLHQQELKSQNELLRRENDSLLHAIELQEELIRRLRTDSALVESMARTQLGMSRKGEMVFRFVPAQNGNGGGRTSAAGKNQ